MAWEDDLARVSWQDFERQVGALFEAEGYRVEYCGTGETGQRFDGGVDLILRRPGEMVLVQCKHWNAAQVPHNDVHQLIGVVETRQANAGILVTSGEFTPAARDAAAKSRRISLMDGVDLRARLGLNVSNGRRPSSAGRREGWSAVADKALDAGMFLATRGKWSRRGRAQRSVGDEIKLMLIRLAIAAGLALLALAFIRHQLGVLQDAMRSPASGRAGTSMPAPAPRAMAPSGSPDAKVSGPSYVPQRMTPEQLEEEKRKNAEAMEILEKTTPSVYD